MTRLTIRPELKRAYIRWALTLQRRARAQSRGDFGRMVTAELRLDKSARQLRNGLRWFGASECEVESWMQQTSEGENTIIREQQADELAALMERQKDCALPRSGWEMSEEENAYWMRLLG